MRSTHYRCRSKLLLIANVNIESLCSMKICESICRETCLLFLAWVKKFSLFFISQCWQVWPGCEPRTSYSGLGSPAHLDHRALQAHPHKDMGNPKPSTLHQSGQFPSANWSFLSVPIEFFQLLLECHMERNDPCGSSAGHNLLDPSIDL